MKNKTLVKVPMAPIFVNVPSTSKSTHTQDPMSMGLRF